jgi:hypothetical protein
MTTPRTQMSPHPAAKHGERDRQPAGEARAFSPAEVAFLIGVPLLWAILLLFHPTGDGDEFYPIVRDQVTAWQVVHVGTLLLVPLLACVVYLLLRGVVGVAALLRRTAIAVFAVFYTAFEVLIGLGTGILIEQVNALPAAQRATGARLVEDFTDSSLIRTFELIGSFAWLIAVAAAGVALFRRAAARSSVAVVLRIGSRSLPSAIAEARTSSSGPPVARPVWASAAPPRRRPRSRDRERDVRSSWGRAASSFTRCA